jgi:serine/threonine-protein kinase
MMDTDRNLLFGVLALQGDLIDAGQFAEACTSWAAHKDRTLASVVRERGWISDDDARVVEELLEIKMRKHGSSARQVLADVSRGDAKVHASVAQLRDALENDADVRQTLADLPQPGRETIQYIAPLGRDPEQRDRYTLTTLHAKGGVGQVWLARDMELEREVALKELRPEQAGNDTSLRRFLQEAKVTGQLDHPGVVPIYELAQGAQGSGAAVRPYYTMRFIRGRTLSEAVADYHRRRALGQAGRIDLVQLLQAFVGLCNTVAFAHQRGVIHRDLKGSNIVLGEFGEVVLLDWGLAKMVDRPAADRLDGDPEATGAWVGSSSENDAGLTGAGQALGTPAFMAPEQAEGRLNQIGKRTDVYGLGAILYEIVAGRPPFEGSSVAEVLRKVRDEPPIPPRQFWKKVPRALEAVCSQALAKNPADRYGSAVELGRDIQHWLANEPVSAYQEPWSTRAQRWISRNRTLVAAGAAALFVTAIALGGLTVAQARANRELSASLDREQSARSEAGEHAGIALRAIDSFYSGVSEDVMLRRPELEDLRRRLLGTALRFYEKFAGALENTMGQPVDTGRRTEIARALERVASLQALLGDKDQAIASRRKAIAIYDAVPNPLAAAIGKGDLASNERLAGRQADAIASLREALGRFEEINVNGIYNFRVGNTLADLGRILSDRGEREEARRLLERAREILEAAVRDSPKTLLFKSNLAAVYTTLGNMDDDDDRVEPARANYEKAARLLEATLALNPKDRFYRAELARACNNLGIALARSGQIDAGRRELERGRAIRETLLKEQPLNIEVRSDLARSHFHFARLEQLAGQSTEALRQVEQAENIYGDTPPKGPEDVYFQACLKALRAGLVGAGKPERAVTPAEREDRRRAAGSAMDYLKRAVAGGFSDPTKLRNHRELEPLRSRADFQELLHSIEARPRSLGAAPQHSSS